MTNYPSPALSGDTSQTQDKQHDLLTGPNKEYEVAATSHNLPPLYTPNVTETRDSSGDVLQLLKFLQESEQRRLHLDELRHQQYEEQRRQESVQLRQEEHDRFTALPQTMTLMASATTVAANQDPNVTHTAATMPTTPTVGTTPSSKSVSQCLPTLQTDVTFQVFRQWHRK